MPYCACANEAGVNRPGNSSVYRRAFLLCVSLPTKTISRENKTEKLFQSQITSQINIQNLIIYNKMVVLSFQISADAFKCR